MKKLIILVTILVALTGCFRKNNENEKKTPTKDTVVEVKESGVVENREYSGIKVENIKFVYNGKETVMSFTVINSRSTVVTLGRFDVIIKGNDGNELGKFESYVPSEIAPNASTDVSLSLDKDFSKATRAEFIFIDLKQE